MLVGECGHSASDFIEILSNHFGCLDMLIRFGMLGGFLRLSVIPEGSPVAVWDS